MKPLSRGLSANELADDMATVARRYRNGLAHTDRADKSLAGKCISFVLGDLAGSPSTLVRQGLLVRILDALD